MHGTICDSCGKHKVGIREFTEFDKVVPCTDDKGNGVRVPSWKPAFKNDRELCFPCFNIAAQKYKTETNNFL